MQEDKTIVFDIKLAGEQSKDFYRNVREMKERLAAMKPEDKDIYFDIKGDRLIIGFYTPFFNKREHNKRHAGRKKKVITSETETKTIIYKGEQIDVPRQYRYSDIVFKMQTMKIKDIIEQTQIKPATFYRRLKALKESEYMQLLDDKKISNMEYLESVPGNKYF